jgi:hypothetical protein
MSDVQVVFTDFIKFKAGKALRFRLSAILQVITTLL